MHNNGIFGCRICQHSLLLLAITFDEYPLHPIHPVVIIFNIQNVIERARSLNQFKILNQFGTNNKLTLCF